MISYQGALALGVGVLIGYLGNSAYKARARNRTLASDAYATARVLTAVLTTTGPVTMSDADAQKQRLTDYTFKYVSNPVNGTTTVFVVPRPGRG